MKFLFCCLVFSKGPWDFYLIKHFLFPYPPQKKVCVLTSAGMKQYTTRFKISLSTFLWLDRMWLALFHPWRSGKPARESQLLVSPPWLFSQGLGEVQAVRWRRILWYYSFSALTERTLFAHCNSLGRDLCCAYRMGAEQSSGNLRILRNTSA